MIFQAHTSPAVLALQATLIAGMVAISLKGLFTEPRPKLTRAGLLAMTFGTLLLTTSKFAEFTHAS